MGWKLGKGTLLFYIRPFFKDLSFNLAQINFYLIYSARIEDLALRAWAIGARWQLKTQVLFFLFSYTPHLAQGHNGLPCYHAPYSVVIPFHLSQGYNAYPKRPQNHSLCGLFKCKKTNKKKNRNAYGIPVFLHNIVSVSSPYFVSTSAIFSPQSTSIMANCRSVITRTRTDPVCGKF